MDPCLATLDSPPRRFASLQKAVDAAADGATITVTGACTGPVRIVERHGLTIQGVPPPGGGCPAEGLRPRDLLSTVRGSRQDRAVIEVKRSANIVVRFLNVIDGVDAGVGLEHARASRVGCNCLARNGDEGLEVEGGKQHEISGNLVTGNAEEGIDLEDGTRRNEVRGNVVEANGEDGIELDDSDDNTIVGNTVRGNARGGIVLDDADRNRVVGNQVTENGRPGRPEGGIELDDADRNVVDGNTIRDNADGLTDRIRCRSGEGNSGSNVVRRCR
jgi:parallel beta-helix repeat protein